MALDGLMFLEMNPYFYTPPPPHPPPPLVLGLKPSEALWEVAGGLGLPACLLLLALAADELRCAFRPAAASRGAAATTGGGGLLSEMFVELLPVSAPRLFFSLSYVGCATFCLAWLSLNSMCACPT